jgi:haloalkane dehalogenase
MPTPSFAPDPDLYPFESRWFESSAGRMHYVDEGSGPPILFCHGNPTWSFLYRGIIERLRGSFRCIAADMHGFGLSERPAHGYTYTPAEHVRTVGELVDHLGLDEFIMMGQDWGGPVGLGVATERAEHVRGVALGNTWFWPPDRLLVSLTSRLLSTPPMQLVITGSGQFVERFVQLGTARTLSRAERAHYSGAQSTRPLRVGVATFPRQLRAAREFFVALERTVPERLGDKPALITWGMKDWGVPAKTELPRARAAFSDCVVVELPRASHYIQEDAPAEIAEAITRRFSCDE